MVSVLDVASMTPLQRLAEAEGGSRELDAVVAEAAGWRWVNNMELSTAMLSGWHDDRGRLQGFCLPEWSTSVDAALTLGHDATQKIEILKAAMRDLSERGAWHIRTPNADDLARLPLAICIAALSAREARK